MRTGTVASYDPDTGNGLIRPDDSDDTIPFNTDSLNDPAMKDRLYEGDRVRFGVEGGLAGLICTDLERDPS